VQEPITTNGDIYSIIRGNKWCSKLIAQLQGDRIIETIDTKNKSVTDIQEIGQVNYKEREVKQHMHLMFKENRHSSRTSPPG
jgi:hypothetical protein